MYRMLGNFTGWVRHVPPCPPKRTISGRRDQLVTNTMNNVFQLRFEKSCIVQVLSGEMGKFVDINSSQSIFNEIIEGIFEFKTLQNGNTVMTFDSVSIKRFSIIFAFFRNKSWRLRLRMVVTTSNGIIAFPMTKTLFTTDGKIEIPQEFRTNTVLMFGLHSEADEINLALRVFANSTGLINENHFNGYECAMKWNKREDTMNVPDCLWQKNVCSA